MTLRTRALGGTGLEITTVGFGAWAISGTGWKFAWGPREDTDSAAAVLRAVEAGVNWIGTAPVYGLGHSERPTWRGRPTTAQARSSTSRCTPAC